MFRAGTVDSWSFEPIQGRRAHESAVDQIVFAIRSGIFGVGERLPSIEKLAEAFKISKPTVGEAIRVLVESGVVESRRGVNGGVTVLDDTMPVTLLGSSHPNSELLEARRAVEVEIAVLAGERMGANDVAVMEQSIDRLREHVVADFNVRIHYDHLFHYAMARAGRSELLAHYQHLILKELVVAFQPYFLDEEDPEVVVAMHEQTLAALRTGDAEKIRQAMLDHLRPLEMIGTDAASGHLEEE